MQLCSIMNLLPCRWAFVLCCYTLCFTFEIENCFTFEIENKEQRAVRSLTQNKRSELRAPDGPKPTIRKRERAHAPPKTYHMRTCALHTTKSTKAVISEGGGEGSMAVKSTRDHQVHRTTRADNSSNSAGANLQTVLGTSEEQSRWKHFEPPREVMFRNIP